MALIFVSFIVLFSGCIQEKKTEPTGSAVTVKLEKKADSLQEYLQKNVSKASKEVKLNLSGKELSFLQGKEKIYFNAKIKEGRFEVEKNGLAYITTFPAIKTGESTEIIFLNEKATLVFANKNEARITGKETYNLKNFNKFREGFNTEFLLENGKLKGIRLYNTSVIKGEEALKKSMEVLYG
jgi:anti-sigma28 factor (negative regulator of flagellin synthesis)